jgi:hypothetical protein
VTTIILRQYKQGRDRQQFLVLQTEIPKSNDLWIKLDPATELRDSSFSWGLPLVDFSPRALAMISGNEAKLTEGPESDIITTVRFIGPQMVSLFTLRILLSSFFREAEIYAVATYNFQLFCSVFLLVLSSKYPHIVEGRPVMSAGHFPASLDPVNSWFLKKIQESVYGEDSMPPETPSDQTKAPSTHSLPSTPIFFCTSDQPYFEFSNFAPTPIKCKGEFYPPAECLFHSQVCNIGSRLRSGI